MRTATKSILKSKSTTKTEVDVAPGKTKSKRPAWADEKGGDDKVIGVGLTFHEL